MKRPSPAFVLAFVALLVALGGTAFAIANNSVGARKLAVVHTRVNSIVVPAGSARTVSKTCKPGELALSAGANWNGAATVGPVLQAATYVFGGPDPTGGTAVGRNQGGGPRTLFVGVNCLRK
jgi:hypothetical protein